MTLAVDLTRSAVEVRRRHPRLSVSTSKRAGAAEEVLDDAVFNAGRAAMVAAALLKGPGKSATASSRGDERPTAPTRPHQAHQRRDAIIAAAYDAGALGVCVCGSGPTIMGVGSKWATRIGEAMVECFNKQGHQARYEVLSFEPAGTISLGVHNF